MDQRLQNLAVEKGVTIEGTLFADFIQTNHVKASDVTFITNAAQNNFESQVEDIENMPIIPITPLYEPFNQNGTGTFSTGVSFWDMFGIGPLAPSTEIFVPIYPQKVIHLYVSRSGVELKGNTDMTFDIRDETGTVTFPGTPAPTINIRQNQSTIMTYVFDTPLPAGTPFTVAFTVTSFFGSTSGTFRLVLYGEVS